MDNTLAIIRRALRHSPDCMHLVAPCDCGCTAALATFDRLALLFAGATDEAVRVEREKWMDVVTKIATRLGAAAKQNTAGAKWGFEHSEEIALEELGKAVSS